MLPGSVAEAELGGLERFRGDLLTDGSLAGGHASWTRQSRLKIFGLLESLVGRWLSRIAGFVTTRSSEGPLYSLRLLGAPSLEGPTGHVTGHAVQPRQMAVLAVVAAAEEAGITRDKLTGLLWPEIPDEAARHTLRDALYLLRGTLGEVAIERSGGLLRISREHLWTDIGAFREAIAAGDPEAAVEFYRGPFLDGFYSRHGVDFEFWVDATRKQLATQYEEVLISLAHAAERKAIIPLRSPGGVGCLSTTPRTRVSPSE